MRLGVVGKRDWTQFQHLELVMDVFLSRAIQAHEVLTIVTGDADGADQCAREWAKKQLPSRVTLVVKEADWDAYGRGAGPRRNTEIVAESDFLLAGWDYYSKGTKDSVSKAVVKGIPVWIVSPDGSAKIWKPGTPLDARIARAIQR